MAVHAWHHDVHFLVLFLLILSSPLNVRCIGLENFVGTCGSTFDLMQTNTQSALLKVPMPDDMKMYQDPTRDIKCDIIITFTNGMNLLLDLYYVDIFPLSGDRKSCPTGLEIFDQTGRKYFGSRICMEAWEWEEKHQQTKYQKLVVESSPLTFRLVSDGPYKGQGFRVHINQFRPYWPCYQREFKCEQVQRCVHDDITCDGWDDCGDNSDERVNAGCHLLTASEICAVIIGALLLIGTGVLTVWFCMTYSQMSREFGMKITESKMPIAMYESKASLDPSLSFPRRYNSKESLGKMSRSTAPPYKYASDNSLDKAELEKAERMTNDNMSERSYRSNPKKNYLNNTSQVSEVPEPVPKTGQYSTRRGRNSSQTSLNREKGLPPNENDRGSLEKDGREKKSLEKDGPDDDRPQRRRSRDRSPYRDRYYSDDDSDYDRYRDRRRRRRSYDRYSDEDSDYEYERRRRSRDRYRDRYDDDSEEDSDREYRRRSSRDRYRGSRERDRGSRERDRGSREKDLDKAKDVDRDKDDVGPRDSRDRDRRRDEEKGRRSPSDRDDRGRRSPYDDDYDDDRRRRHSRRSRSGDRKRDSYDDDDRRRHRGRSPERKSNYSPPPYPGKKDNLGPADDAPLPAPPTGEEIRRIELAKQLADQAKSAGQPSKAKLDPIQKPKDEPPKIPDLPKYEPQKSVTDVPRQEQPKIDAGAQRSSNAPSRQSHEPSKKQYDQPKQSYDQPKQSYDQPKQSYDQPKQSHEPSKKQYDQPKQSYDPPKQSYEPPKQYEAPKQQYEPPKAAVEAPKVEEPPKTRWEPPAKKRPPLEPQKSEPVDENTRRRNTTDRRERYSKNRWTPKDASRHQDSPPPEYEDVSLPPTTNIKVNYREESV